MVLLYVYHKKKGESRPVIIFEIVNRFTLVSYRVFYELDVARQLLLHYK